MNKYAVISSIACIFVFVSACIISTNGLVVHVDDLPKPVDGLSWTFYEKSCPDLEYIVKSTLEEALDEDITQAAGLLRLHFHDCFVQGCDGSVLLTGSTSNPSEQQAPPNLLLRARALQLINEIKIAAEASCRGAVTCADILALAARESVAKLMNIFGRKGFSLTDMVALSGGHTIGLAHCNSFDNRLYNKTTGKAIMAQNLANSLADDLYSLCPTVNNTVDFTNLDVQTPNAFDKKYYVNLQKNKGLLTSDQSLYTDSTDSEDIVDSFASSQTVFFKKFVLGMHKMGQLDVLTGKKGEIRTTCSIPNPPSSGSEEVIEPIVETREFSSFSDAHSEL
eukprot:PITA_22863